MFPLGCEDDEEALRKLNGPESCTGLVESLERDSSLCDRDGYYGKYCRKSCDKCGKMLLGSFLVLCQMVYM